MSRSPSSADGNWVTESPDRPRVPAEIVFLLVVLMLSLIFSLAGIPGETDRVVTDGSDDLRRGWLAERVREEQALIGEGIEQDPPSRRDDTPPAGR